MDGTKRLTLLRIRAQGNDTQITTMTLNMTAGHLRDNGTHCYRTKIIVRVHFNMTTTTNDMTAAIAHSVLLVQQTYARSVLCLSNSKVHKMKLYDMCSTVLKVLLIVPAQNSDTLILLPGCTAF